MKTTTPAEASDFLADLVVRKPGLNPIAARLATRSELFVQMTQGRGKPQTFGKLKKDK